MEMKERKDEMNRQLKENDRKELKQFGKAAVCIISGLLTAKYSSEISDFISFKILNLNYENQIRKDYLAIGGLVFAAKSMFYDGLYKMEKIMDKSREIKKDYINFLEQKVLDSKKTNKN